MMKKILVIGPPKSYHTEQHIENARNEGYKLTYIAFRDKWKPVDSTYYISLIKYIPYRIMLLIAWIKTRFIINKIKPDIVHAHYLTPFCLFTFPCNRRTILTLWGSDIKITYKKMGFIMKKISNISMKNAAYVSIPGDYMRKYLPSFNNITTTVWGIDINKTGNRNEDDRRYVGFPVNSIVITSIRVNRDIFQIERVINAAEILRDAYPDIILNIIEGPYIEYNKKIRRITEGKDYINIFKYLDNDDYLKLLRASDIGISIATTDAGPVSVKESMAIGLPVIFQSIDGIEETINDMETGKALYTYSVDELVSVIKELIENKELWSTLSGNAGKYSRENFNRHSYFSKISKLYREI